MKGLILTLGLSPEPLILTYQKLQPDLLAFIGTEKSVEESIDKIVEETGLKPSQYKVLEIQDDPDQIGQVIAKLAAAVDWMINRGIAREAIQIDPTGGRKWMSAGAILYASVSALPMIYVDVQFIKRVIQPETMQVIPLGNAYDQTGYLQSVQGRESFNSANFDQAESYFSIIRPTSSSKADLFAGLAKLAAVMGRWDRFEHYQGSITEQYTIAIDLLDRSLRGGLGRQNFSEFVNQCREHRDALAGMEGEDNISPEFIIDVFQNAVRRFEVKRYDDCVSRLYRTLEAIGQYLLFTEHGVISSSPDYQKLSDDQTKQFKAFKGELPHKLDCTGNFHLLHFLGNSNIQSVVRPGKKDALIFTFSSLLEARNSSILAHGFKPVSADLARSFIERIEGLLKAIFSNYSTIAQQLAFPRLPDLGL